MKRNCNNPDCGKEYTADMRNVNRGNGLCCSKSCAATLREKVKRTKIKRTIDDFFKADEENYIEWWNNLSISERMAQSGGIPIDSETIRQLFESQNSPTPSQPLSPVKLNSAFKGSETKNGYIYDYHLSNGHVITCCSSEYKKEFDKYISTLIALPEELVREHYDAARSKKPISDHTAISINYMGRFAEWATLNGWAYYKGTELWRNYPDKLSTPQLIELFFKSQPKI